MANYPPPKEEKLIFAPTPSAPNQTTTPTTGAAQFTLSTLHRHSLNPTDPISQFHTWYSSATPPLVPHPETCTLATASLPSGRVSARMVYLKELDHAGFVIYSNFGTSQKGADLFGTGPRGTGEGNGNPWAALVFWWEALERQVRVEGRCERLSAEESAVYFRTRARGSRIGAWSSRQSEVLKPNGGKGEGGKGEDDGRGVLEGWVRETEERFEGVEDVPVPEFWGGLRVVPERVEFWQGRESRLHDRFVYDRVEGGEGGWRLERLSP